jgi:hypothetical protein
LTNTRWQGRLGANSLATRPELKVALDVCRKQKATLIIAKLETSARRFASEKASGEGGFVWLDPEHSTCAELTPEGKAGVVIADHDAE